MARVSITRAEQRRIDALIKAYEHHKPRVSLFKDQLLTALLSTEQLNQHVHSIRSRLKDPNHLRDKLIRKLITCKTDRILFDLTEENLLMKINDLAGVRILHLYTRQVRDIDKALREIFQENQYELLEGPFARSWDDESRTLFREIGIETQESPSMYTSVHYVVGSASRTKVTAEIQVRTLMEEVWGEVDHTLNYPHKTNNLACAEQLKVLARVTSSATRLVDCIFLTMEEHLLGSRAPATTAATTASARRHTGKSPKPVTHRGRKREVAKRPARNSRH